MMQDLALTDEHVIRALRVLVADLNDKHSPFSKDENYMRSLSGWIAEAANRLEQKP